MIVTVIVPAVGFVAFLGAGVLASAGLTCTSWIRLDGSIRQLGPMHRAAVIEDRWRCRFMQTQNKREKALLYKARVLFFYPSAAGPPVRFVSGASSLAQRIATSKGVSAQSIQIC